MYKICEGAYIKRKSKYNRILTGTLCLFIHMQDEK